MKNKKKVLTAGIIILICIVILIGFTIYLNKHYLNTTLSENEAKQYEKYQVHLPNPQDSIFKYVVEHSEFVREEPISQDSIWWIYNPGPELYNLFYQCSIIHEISVSIHEDSENPDASHSVLYIWYDTEDGTEVRLTYTDDDVLGG